MHHVTRIVGIAAIAVCSLLLGMRLSPQDAPAKKGAAAERYEAVREMEKYAADLKHSPWESAPELKYSPWESAPEVEPRVLWSRRYAEAAIDAGALTAREAYRQHVARMEAMLQVGQSLKEAGRRAEIDLALLRFHVADAKLLLERCK